MSGVRTTLVSDAHEYTRSSVPWRLETKLAAKGETHTGKKYGWKLIHYLSGGGMRTFGRTIRQEEASVKRTRFLVAAGVVGLLWLWFLVG